MFVCAYISASLCEFMYVQGKSTCMQFRKDHCSVHSLSHEVMVDIKAINNGLMKMSSTRLIARRQEWWYLATL